MINHNNEIWVLFLQTGNLLFSIASTIWQYVKTLASKLCPFDSLCFTSVISMFYQWYHSSHTVQSPIYARATPHKLMPSNIAFFLYFLSEFPGTNSECVLYAKYTIDQSQYCNLKSSPFLLQDWQVNFFPLLQQSENMKKILASKLFKLCFKIWKKNKSKLIQKCQFEE